ncbi:L-threonylcarbamoyladenylate synthase [Anaerosporobacter faecicola]|uniref:L-threonylcarbamoyladenylate synthase n=1 Tax=Anaerosporobacter faecicola TaxID=2718714 RepID=UPI0014399156|nr:L-threonylcarbamoyladenylate synthase [Anaerosporobacter faecicola]
MKTIVKKINEQDMEPGCLREAATILKEEGLVAFPTETVYGLGGDALDFEAAKKIYAAKGRPSDNPLIVHIADVDSLEVLAKEVPEKAYILAKHFWPGPLTMIMKKSEVVPNGTTGGLDTVAIRMPNNKIALQLIRESGVYIAAPSANTSGRPSPTKAEHVVEDLSGKIDMILDGGPVGIGLESTILDLTGEIPTILRPGYITKEMLEEVIGPVTIDKAILSKNIDPNVKPKAPGMKYKHYAPKADLTIVEGPVNAVVREINALAKKQREQGKCVGIIATDETYAKYQADVVKTIGSREDEEQIARGLYGILRDFDELKVDVIYSEGFAESNLGQAIMNRLLKAAGYQVVEV